MQNDVAHVEAYLPVISAALAAEGIQLSSAARSALAGLEAAPLPPHPRAARLELLEALREVTTVYCAADVLAARHVVEVVTACLQFPCPAVQQIAQHALRQWRRVALVHLRVFTGAATLEGYACSCAQSCVQLTRACFGADAQPCSHTVRMFACRSLLVSQ